MASVRLVKSFYVDQISLAVVRRGFATQGSVSGSVRGSGVVMMKKGSEESKTPWVPDPVTGYYKPEGQSNEIDAAELRRQLLLNQKNHRN